MKGSKYLFLTAATISLLFAAAPPALAQSANQCSTKPGEERPWLNPDYSPECRGRFALNTFQTLDEKLEAITASFGRDGTWITDLGLPQLRGGDGPAGIRGGGVAVTSFPVPLAMAASFDGDTAFLYGKMLGEESIAYGSNRLGGPALDITRTWNFGRSSESHGEDPYLARIMAGREVAGIQSQHVMSMTKHYAVYTQEQGRAGDHPLRTRPAVNNIVSERAIREIYLPGFEGAVRDGGAGQIMCSFPRVNGIYACEHAPMLNILKKEWGFDGMVVPDFPDAQRSIIAAVNAGLDSGIMISSPPPVGGTSSLATATDNTLNGEDLRVAVKTGQVSPARIDDMLLRRLVPGFRIGAFDHPAKRVAEDVSTPERRAIAAQIVARGTVLLKNEGGILPFGPDVKSVAVIGHQAGPGAYVAIGGSAHVDPMHLEPVYPAIRQRGGTAVRTAYAQGTLGLGRLPIIPTNMIRSADGKAGFTAEYFANANLDFSAAPFLHRQEAAVENTELPNDPLFPANRQWSARWTGHFTPVEDGVQHFTMAGSGTGRLYIDGKLMGEYANVDFGHTVYANVPMQAGKAVQIRVEWTPRVTFRVSGVDDYGTTLGPVVRLGWSGPNDLMARAASAAGEADVAVVFVGDRVGEGMDRLTLALPNDQNALIEAVAAANPNTVVVMQTGGAHTMPWLDKVKGVMQMWLPGDAAGPAATSLLFGDSEPGGRLPVTFPKDEMQGPARQLSQYPGAPDATGAVGDALFSEGIFVGYRYWDQFNQEPLFPFGYGLSYTAFDMDARPASRTADGGANVAVTVRNTGQRVGSEVVQVYVGFPRSAGAPPRQLMGFSKVTLQPGEARTVEIGLDKRAFQYWNEKKGRWTRDAGTYNIMIGRSSRDIVHTQGLRLPAD
ncbi:MAG TPA: glycoside hydrolase family 3 C-terminal domain-containing protein [Sphingobium sp.]|nr:glycoside hydrolase family 3 C-terminal domain-containing protein [Sphingobium sp.]